MRVVIASRSIPVYSHLVKLAQQVLYAFTLYLV